MQVIGKIEEIHDKVQRSETFIVRDFILEIGNPTSQYTEHVQFQLTGQRCDIIDAFQVGQEVMVDFDLRGRKWTRPADGQVMFFNTLSAWRISPYNGQQQPAPGFGQQPMGGYGQPAAYGQQPMGGYQQQPMGGFQQPVAPQQPMQAPMPQAPQQPAAPSANDGSDLPF